MISEILEKFRNKKRKFQETQEDFRISKLVEEREKTANERELERFMEEERQKNIKIHLDSFRKKRQHEINSMNILKGKNIFKGHKSILAQPNIFRGNKNLFLHQRSMFIK